LRFQRFLPHAQNQEGAAAAVVSFQALEKTTVGAGAHRGPGREAERFFQLARLPGVEITGGTHRDRIRIQTPGLGQQSVTLRLKISFSHDFDFRDEFRCHRVGGDAGL
jgi:hypothetical protein